MGEYDFPALYREVRERFGGRVAGLDDTAARTPVGACPGWDVRAVLSHVTGVVADIQDGRLEGAGSDEWTTAQVAGRRDRSLAEIVAEWDARAPALEEQLGAWPPDLAGQIVSDVTTHELDVRGALGDTGARDTECVRYAFERYAGRLGTRIAEAGLPALRLVTDGDDVVAGAGEPAATVRAPRYELARAMAGRRSVAQVRAYAWEGDPEPYLAVFSGYGHRVDDLAE
ncbi:MAG TPA: maleylpyruvate isomerase family mycothiol-dependent enzyme, partial [Acidimicrobiia bacterium]|nr:maleylpyruvate isomerase family mycothiol-dependent enzyme [Acidimicrobiia bacterium]